jgi:TolB-like protein/Tfp pilus assembly protein PilF
MGASGGYGRGPPTGLKPGALTDLLRQVAAAPGPAQAEPSPLLPGSVVGRFEILRELGRGGFGVVYEARDRELGRQVALKLVWAGGAAVEAGQVAREAEAIARLSHPNLVTLHDLGRSDVGPYLVFELLRGRTLQARIDDGPLQLREAVHVAVEVARGLAHAHAEGVVHRDLKPSNVFETDRGQVKILDFGMAHAFGRRRVSGGTPAYMAPEQWVDAPEDERTDVFALGVMLFRMLSGEYPFPEDGGRWSSGPATAPRLDVPGVPGLEELVGRMLDKAPTGRPRDGAAVLTTLSPIEEALRSQPAADTPPAYATRRKGRRAAARLVALGVAAVLAGAGWYGWRRAGERGRGSVATAAGTSIAVLPFADMSQGKDQEYLADGLSEEVLNLLAQLPQLRVIARTSSFSFKGKGVDVATIARTLNVGHLLEGSIRKAGDTVRVKVELIRASDSSHLWSQTFDRKLTDVFNLQDEIARAVVTALQVKLLPAERERLAAAPAVDAEAHDAYLKGLYHWYKLTREDLDTSERYFELALSRAPGYARAHAGIALIWLGRNQMGFTSPEEGVPKAKAAAMKALALDDALAEVHYALAILHTWADWDWPAGEREFRRAIAINPGFADAHAYYAHFLSIMRRPDEAAAEVRRALELDPINGLFHSLYGVVLSFERRFDEAIAQYDIALAMNPKDALALGNLVAARHHRGEHAQALEALKRYAGEVGYREVTTLLARTPADLGYRQTMQRAAEALAVRSRTTFVLPWDLIGLYAYAGDTERCLEWLERAYQGRDPNMPYLWYPDFDGVRSDPRFQDLLRRMKLPMR